MQGVIYIVYLLALSCITWAQLIPTQEQVANMSTELQKHIEADLSRLGGLVRLAFHDCVGGCDGCVNLQNGANAGLQRYIRDLENVFANFDDVISRADFWQLAALEALERAAGTDRPNIPFLVGRVDCATSPDTSDIEGFPTNGGHGDLRNVLDFFQAAFGFGARDAVAILGAHTLGRARSRASGFNGPWVRNSTLFDNAYYRDLLLLNQNFDWIQIDIADPTDGARWQWTRGGRSRGPMMLNADMCLVKNITVESNGRSICTYDSCVNSSTRSVVEEYAVDNSLWVREYSRAHAIMTSTGYDDDDLTSPS